MFFFLKSLWFFWTLPCFLNNFYIFKSKFFTRVLTRTVSRSVVWFGRLVIISEKSGKLRFHVPIGAFVKPYIFLIRAPPDLKLCKYKDLFLKGLPHNEATPLFHQNKKKRGGISFWGSPSKNWSTVKKLLRKGGLVNPYDL